MKHAIVFRNTVFSAKMTTRNQKTKAVEQLGYAEIETSVVENNTIENATSKKTLNGKDTQHKTPKTQTL